MPISQQDKTDALREIFDEQKVNLYCSAHNYFGPVKNGQQVLPTMGCPNCLKVFFIHELATTPPSQRAQKLEELEEVIHEAVQLDDQGKFDFEPTRHPKIEIVSE